MKFLFSILIPILFCLDVEAQCPSNENTSIEIKKNGNDTEVHVKFEQNSEEFREINVIKFGAGLVEEALIRKKNKKEIIINKLDSGEYMIQIIGSDCTSFVGTDEYYRGFIIK